MDALTPSLSDMIDEARNTFIFARNGFSSCQICQFTRISLGQFK